MKGERRQQVAAAFSAARDYDGHARVQREAAQALAARIARLDLPPSSRILEIGCGTGYLTESLLEKGVAGNWLVTDISPQMVERCRSRIGERRGLRYAVLDGASEQPGFAGAFDLVCSNLAVQWLGNLHDAVARFLTWLSPGGHCLFTTLGAGTFAEWRMAHKREGLEAGTLEFASAPDLAGLFRDAQASAPVIEQYRERHQTAAAFLTALKAIGAATPNQRHWPLSPAQLKRVMRNFERSGATATYQVMTCHYRSPQWR